jgi:hypothetical protein
VVGVYFDVLEGDFLLEKDEEDALDEGAELFGCEVMFCVLKKENRVVASSYDTVMDFCPFHLNELLFYYLNYRGNMNV